MTHIQTDRIRADISESYVKMKKAWTNPGSGFVWNEEEETARAHIEIALSEYLAFLGEVEQSAEGNLKKRIAYASKMILERHDAGVASLVRSLARVKNPLKPSELLKMAWSFSVYRPLKEKVVIHWRPKSGGKFRPICIFGPNRKAQCFLVRDMLMVAGISSNNNYATKGSGGEKALVRRVCEYMENGVKWWWTPDIKSAFPSMRRGHFNWIGMDRRLLSNVVYLPKCAKVVTRIPKDLTAFNVFIQKETSDDQMDITTYVENAKLKIQQGLPQGSVLSPLLAGALISKVWKDNVSQSVGVMLNWHDDLCVGTETKEQITNVKEILTSAMMSLSAGSIEFHECKILPAKSKAVSFLGLVIQPGRGHIHYPDGSRSIHVKPGLKRIVKFLANLERKLEAVEEGEDLFTVADEYHLGWYNSIGPWTKVPGHSYTVSLGICTTYVQDFKNGIELGSGWVK